MEAMETETTTAAAPPPPPTTTDAPPASKPPKMKAAKPLSGLPAWTAGYRGWTRIAAALPPRDSDPHLGTKNVFVSKPARDGVFPVGAIVVKEGFRPGKDFVGLIATMRKIEGADPEHGDWVWVEWARDAPNAAFSELARDSVCWSCHVSAVDKDWVFTNG
jgi:hypothetical protein